jgi:hypothetical protein
MHQRARSPRLCGPERARRGTGGQLPSWRLRSASTGMDGFIDPGPEGSAQARRPRSSRSRPVGRHVATPAAEAACSGSWAYPGLRFTVSRGADDLVPHADQDGVDAASRRRFSAPSRSVVSADAATLPSSSAGDTLRPGSLSDSKRRPLLHTYAPDRWPRFRHRRDRLRSPGHCRTKRSSEPAAGRLEPPDT